MERKLNWWTLIVTALVTGIVTIITGVIVNNINNSKPHLQYTYQDILPFSGEKKEIGILPIKISNPGKKNS